MNGGFGRMDRMHPLYARNDMHPILRNRRTVPAAYAANTIPNRAGFGASSVQRSMNLGCIDPREAWVIAAMQNGLVPPLGVSLAPVPVGGTQLSSLRTPFEFDLVHRALGGSPSSSLDTWRPTHLPCSTNSSSCRASRVSGYLFDTKDIVVRGRARVIRKSYLQESLKFEADLVKYLNTKSEEQVPERVVDLLIEFINADCYDNFDVVDEVTLNILAFNVGAKSVVDFSLKRLKLLRELDSLATLGSITAMILMCSRVDDGLTAWLKKLLEKDNNAYASALVNSEEYRLNVLDERPEVEWEIYRLLGIKQRPKNDNFRSL